MPSLLDIKARIKAVENIKKITRAMQLVAAAKFNRAQNRARSARPYSDELDTVLGALAGLSEDAAVDETLSLSFVEEQAPIVVDRARLFRQVEVKCPGIVLVTADRGLCGAFNTRLIRAALDFVKRHSDKDCRLITIGRKGHTYFKKRDIPILHHEEHVSDRLVLDEIRRITSTLIRFFVEGKVDALYIIYSQFKTAMRSDVRTEKFLSIPPVEGKKEDDVYILEPGEEAVYETLIPLYATTKIFATLADSFASEYGARMSAMASATSNAEEMLEEQILLRNRMRQAIITKELAEIVGGAASQE
ncbi:MAG: ATP synthase F1 subunit gamma [Candidatus Krumholzibacteriia bacterium]